MSKPSDPLEATPAADAANDASTAPKARKPREGTKQATLIALLRRPEGATIEDLSAATEWNANTVRGALAGALKKRLGLEVTSEKDEARGRVYRIACADLLPDSDRSDPIQFKSLRTGKQSAKS